MRSTTWVAVMRIYKGLANYNSLLSLEAMLNFQATPKTL